MSLVQRMPLAADPSFSSSSSSYRQPRSTNRYQNVPPSTRSSSASRYNDYTSTSPAQTIPTPRPRSRAQSTTATNPPRASIRPGPRGNTLPLSPPFANTTPPSRASGTASTAPKTSRTPRAGRITSSRSASNDDDHQDPSQMMNDANVQSNLSVGSSPYQLPPDNDAYATSNATATGSAPVGNSLWQRVAVAVGALSVNVGIPFDTGLVTGDGEQTPVGGESRITVALKSYYISRAQSGADLPDWLFSADERRAAGGMSSARTRDAQSNNSQSLSSSSPPDRGRRANIVAGEESSSRDAYGSSGTSNSSRLGGVSGENQPRSAVSNRLKQRRDALRGTKNNSTGSVAEMPTPALVREKSEFPSPTTIPSRSNNAPRKSDASNSRGKSLGGGLPAGPGGMRSSAQARR